MRTAENKKHVILHKTVQGAAFVLHGGRVKVQRNYMTYFHVQLIKELFEAHRKATWLTIENTTT